MATITDIFETLEYGPAPEAPNPALEWIEEHPPFGLFIGGGGSPQAASTWTAEPLHEQAPGESRAGYR